MEFSQEYMGQVIPRLKKLGVVFFVSFLLILSRLFYLQIIKGSFFRFFSEENSIHEKTVPTLRGVMRDRNGKLLVDNRAAFDLVLIPQYVADADSLFRILKRELGISEALLQKQWKQRKRQPAYQPISLLKDVSMDVVSWVKARKTPWGQLDKTTDLRGIEIRLRYEREYPDDNVATHVLGYLREIDRERLKKYKAEMPGRYHRGDQVGVRGLEEIWDADIRGYDGYQQKVINAVGREINRPDIEQELIQKEARLGDHLQLTLDARLQKTARDYFEGKEGAAVALDPENGAVLLMYSAPSADLNRISREGDTSYWEKLTTHSSRFLLNRAIQGAYPPGSVYKLIAGLAALQEKVILPHEKIYCDGGFFFKGRRYSCWKKEGHGYVDFYKALVTSCDTYFYTVGLRLGVDRLARYARAFGLGKSTRVGFDGERDGLVPDSQWKEKAKKEPWYEGETLSVAIGQGYNSVTPMQAAVMAAMIANGGKKVQPYLVKATVNPYNLKETPVERVPPDVSDIVFSKEALEWVRKSMVGVIEEENGTAHRLSAMKIPMAGKTGTSQVVSARQGCNDKNCRDHAWFVAYAPVQNPKIAIAVLVEHGGHGSSSAAPLAGELIKTYLEKEDDAKKNVGKL